MSLSALPNRKLISNGPISQSLLTLGILSFNDAAKWTKDLPYGRNSNRTDFLLVLTERKGTCSSKHALLAQLAQELGLSEIRLVIGIYNMTEQNTPGVGHILEKYRLPYLPEAHCYLKTGDERFDFTRSGCSSLDDSDLVFEVTISPKEIGTIKENTHKAYLQQWLNTQTTLQSSPEELWKIREECIQAISQ
jgi:hypothetical protein